MAMYFFIFRSFLVTQCRTHDIFDNLFFSIIYTFFILKLVPHPHLSALIKPVYQLRRFVMAYPTVQMVQMSSPVPLRLVKAMSFPVASTMNVYWPFSSVMDTVTVQMARMKRIVQQVTLLLYMYDNTVYTCLYFAETYQISTQNIK